MNNNFEAYTFSKSTTMCGFDNKRVFKIKTFNFNSDIFKKCYSNPELILVIFSKSCIGLFLTNSEASLFKVFSNHINYFNESENCSKTKEENNVTPTAKDTLFKNKPASVSKK